ncbi:MAG TPA: AzlD domain-containing protein [Acetobacteraceae bacterium]|nr:AzlD domain-containing protein [Acetobacteraceae bacterium]
MIAGLAAGTLAIRLSGVLVGQRLPRSGAWARALHALPGCLVVSLVAVSLMAGGPREWAAGAVAAAVAILTRNLPATMAAGIAAIWVLRHVG